MKPNKDYELWHGLMWLVDGMKASDKVLLHLVNTRRAHREALEMMRT